MKRLIYLILFSMGFTNADIVAGDRASSTRSEIYAFLKMYNNTSNDEFINLQIFDGYIDLISKATGWNDIASTLLTRIQKHKKNMLLLTWTGAPDPEYDVVRLPVVESYIDCSITLYKQILAALNQKFPGISEADKKTQGIINQELKPFTKEYINKEAPIAFAEHVKTIINKGMPENVSTLLVFEQWFDKTYIILEDAQRYIDQLNAKKDSGLKDAYKKENRSLTEFIAKKFGYENVAPQLNRLRIQQNQLKIIRNVCIQTIDNLFRKISSMAGIDKTSLKRFQEKFQIIKDKRD